MIIHFYRATLCVSTVFAVVRCPSVRLARWCTVSTVQLLSRPGSPIILVYWLPQRRYPIPRGTPSSGAQNTRGGKFLRFSTEISVFIGNGTR